MNLMSGIMQQIHDKKLRRNLMQEIIEQQQGKKEEEIETTGCGCGQ